MRCRSVSANPENCKICIVMAHRLHANVSLDEFGTRTQRMSCVENVFASACAVCDQRFVYVLSTRRSSIRCFNSSRILKIDLRIYKTRTNSLNKLTSDQGSVCALCSDDIFIFSIVDSRILFYCYENKIR